MQSNHTGLGQAKDTGKKKGLLNKLAGYREG
jgi:hypothetical protein